MPDEPEKQKNLPGRHRPRLSELSKETTEEDLWDLEDDSSLSSASSPAEAESIPEPTESKPDFGKKEAASAQKPGTPSVTTHHTKRGSTSAEVKKDVSERPNPPKAARPNGPRPLDPKSSTPQPTEPDAATAPELKSEKPAASEAATVPEPAPHRSEETPSTPDTTPTKPAVGKSDKIGLIAFSVVFLLLGIWWLVGLFSSISTTRIGDDQPEFPAKGEYITIESAQTYWREPIREGSTPDVARREVEFIPVLNVVIDDSETGVLRAIFRNEEGEFVGDSISKKFSNGVFDQNANMTIEFPATDGFKNSGEFNGYRVGSDRWTIEVFEGPSEGASGSEFKLLFTTPIAPNRQ